MKAVQTLNQTRDFLRLYRRGKSQAHPLLVTYCQRSRRGGLRMGITATKKMGGAVARNRAKRLIRAAWRQLAPTVEPGWDFVFVARTRTPGAKMQQVLRVMEAQVRALTAPGPKP